jgi:ribose transport system permease protein
MRRQLRAVVGADWWSLLVVLLIAGVALSVLRPEFTKEFNIYVLIYDISITGLVALAQLVVVATGGFNIAVGALGGLSAILSAGLMVSFAVPVPVALLVGLVAGTAMGFINGLLTVRTGIHSFIITLATASAYEGINLGITSANPYYGLPTMVTGFGQARTAILPHPALISLLLAIGVGVLLYRTVLGRRILAVGGNARSAELAGIRVGRVIITAHSLSGFIGAVAGLLMMARLGLGAPTIGSDWLLPSFATIIIGGAALEGGSVSIMGAILATALLAVIQNGLVIYRADPFWVTFLEGALILGAVGLNRLRSVSGRPVMRGPRIAARFRATST